MTNLRQLAVRGRAEAEVRLRRLRPETPGPAPRIRRVVEGPSTDVDRYWTGHTVNSTPFTSALESDRYLDWRFDEYPLFREFSGLYGDRTGQTVLDYGCGPGNDVVGFLVRGNAAKVIGMDVSPTSLELTAGRVALHHVDPSRAELVQTSDSEHTLPFDDASVDFFSCQGVLHHVADPEPILREICRVLRPGGEGSIMVYNRDSVWWHQYVAYERIIVDEVCAGLSVEEAFRRSTDGPECPISRAYTGAEWTAICERAGFEARFVGGYLSRHELDRIAAGWASAIVDERLAPEHREFLRGLRFDQAGRPMHGDVHAGIGGTYRLRKL